MAEGIPLTEEGSSHSLDELVPSLPENLLAFYYDDAGYRTAESEGVVPRRRHIVFEMLRMMLDVEDAVLLEKLVSDIVLHDGELERERNVDPQERVRTMMEATKALLDGSDVAASASEERLGGRGVDDRMARRLALGVIQSNTEWSHLRAVAPSPSKYVICTSEPCTPIRVLLWITKGEKSASDFLDPSSSDFNPSLISRIRALRSVIRNGIECILLYEIENELSERDKSIACKMLGAERDKHVSFLAKLPKGVFEADDNTRHSGALFYSAVDPSSSSSNSTVGYAFSINATQHKQRSNFDRFAINAGDPRSDPKIGRRFDEEFEFISGYVPEELVEDVALRRPENK